MNDPKKVSVNILTDKDVFVKEADGNSIVVINVPRAQRTDRPVYLEGNPLNAYRRNGEGDYKCTREEVQAMTRDASVKTQDMLVLDEMSLDVFDYDSIHRYRIRMRNYRPGHVWEELEDIDFLYRLGAVGRSSDGKMHPTAAGLLMFGYEYEIVKEYPFYFLDYQEQLDSDKRWTDRIISTSGDWSGNLYDFYFRVYHKITQNIKVPFKLEGGDRIDDTPVHKAFREALANCLINADYYGRQGLVIIKKEDGIVFSNPGGFRIEVEAAKSGGVSDPRNSALIKMFNLIDIGERAGSGIPNIFNVWMKQKWPAPVIYEAFEPDRITFVLQMSESGDIDDVAIISGDKMGKVAEKGADKYNDAEKAAIISGDKTKSVEEVVTKSGDKVSATKTALHKAAIIAYLTEHVTARRAELTQLLGLKASRVKVILGELIQEEIIVAEGANRNRTYRLK